MSILYDANFGNLYTDSVSCHNGANPFGEHRGGSGRLRAGDYIINAAAGGNVGTYRLGEGSGPGAAKGMITGGVFTLSGGCAADLNGDGVLDLFDFPAYTNLFNAQDPGADCDGDGARSLFDFLCSTNAFNAGC